MKRRTAKPAPPGAQAPVDDLEPFVREALAEAFRQGGFSDAPCAHPSANSRARKARAALVELLRGLNEPEQRETTLSVLSELIALSARHLRTHLPSWNREEHIGCLVARGIDRRRATRQERARFEWMIKHLRDAGVVIPEALRLRALNPQWLERMLPIAEQALSWPGMISRFSTRETPYRLLKTNLRLGLGVRMPIRKQSKASPLAAIAWEAVALVERERVAILKGRGKKKASLLDHEEKDRHGATPWHGSIATPASLEAFSEGSAEQYKPFVAYYLDLVYQPDPSRHQARLKWCSDRRLKLNASADRRFAHDYGWDFNGSTVQWRDLPQMERERIAMDEVMPPELSCRTPLTEMSGSQLDRIRNRKGVKGAFRRRGSLSGTTYDTIKQAVLRYVRPYQQPPSTSPLRSHPLPPPEAEEMTRTER